MSVIKNNITLSLVATQQLTEDDKTGHVEHVGEAFTIPFSTLPQPPDLRIASMRATEMISAMSRYCNTPVLLILDLLPQGPFYSITNPLIMWLVETDIKERY